MIDIAERHLQNREVEESSWKRLRNARGWKIAMVVVILLCLAVVAYQGPRILAAVKGPKPIRMGGYDTEAKTDACIKNLWQLSQRMQQGKLASAPELVCPASGKPYRIIKGPVPEAHCPTPEIHGVRDLLVTQKIPVPQLKNSFGERSLSTGYPPVRITCGCATVFCFSLPRGFFRRKASPLAGSFHSGT
jgi:hypothetical protein